MWWLISRVQSSREEVVDQLTVQLTNARKTYLEALLAFADRTDPVSRHPLRSPSSPVPPDVADFQGGCDVVQKNCRVECRHGRRAAGDGSLCLVRVSAEGDAQCHFRGAGGTEPAARSPSRRGGPETARERELKTTVAGGPGKPAQFFELARLQERRGALTEAEGDDCRPSSSAAPADGAALSMLAGFYNRSGQFDKAVGVLEQLAALTPTDAKPYQILATFYWEKAFKDPSLSPEQRSGYIQSGIAATDNALSVNPDYVDALTYKNILLRMKANIETDAARKQALLAEADTLRSRAMELNKARQPQRDMAFVPAPGQPPPPPPPPPPPGELLDGQAPVRVGGNIKPPTKTRDVKPVYPADAQAAGVQGVVIMEATIDPAGNIATARVLRGQPLLDQAALDAVKQWQFAPTMLNNVYVPVIMTVTVNFTLPNRVKAQGSAAQGSGKIFEHVFGGFCLSPEP